MKRPQANTRPCTLARPRELTTAEEPVMTDKAEVRPLQPIRRFDVFAETKRLDALAHVEPDDVAKGYGIRIAKIVASTRFGRSAAKKTHHERKEAPERESTTGG